MKQQTKHILLCATVIALIVWLIFGLLWGALTFILCALTTLVDEPKPAKIPEQEGLFEWPTNQDELVDIVGEAHYQPALKLLAGEHGNTAAHKNCMATLTPEDDNKFDKKAVRVSIDGYVVGYLDKDDARSFRHRLIKHKMASQATKCHAIITGGYIMKNGNRAHYGVTLEIQDL